MTSIQIDIKDGLSSSTAIKGPCRVATTANITLVGEQTIDGVAVVTDDRVLVKNQTTASENGIYIADTGNWRRSKDFNKTKDVKTGTMVNVTSGTVGAGQWQISTTGDITIGTTNIAFAQVVQPYDADLASWAAITRAAGFDAFVATPSSANLKALVSDETGSGALVFAASPTLVTPALGTPSALVLTNATGLPIGGGGTGQTTAAAAFDALSPTTTRGDLIFRNATTNTRLAAGTSGYALIAAGAGADPAWTGFLQTGTGGVTRTWQAKAAERVSILDFGAAGNGSTNDTTAMTNAIAAGRDVYLPPGNYLIDPIAFSGLTSLRIRGGGRDVTKITLNSTGTALTFSNVQWMQFSDLSMQASGTAQSLANAKGIVMDTGSGNCIIERCNFYGFSLGGVHLLGVVGTQMSGHKVKDCIFVGNGGTQFYSLYSNDFTYEGNQYGILGAAAHASIGCLLEHSSHGTYTDNKHWNNVVGFKELNCSANRITNNRMELSDHEGVWFEGSTSSLFEANVIHTNSQTTSGAYDNLYVKSTSRLEILGNQILSWDATYSRYGINIDTGNDEVKIKGNYVRGYDTTSFGPIRIDGTATRIAGDKVIHVTANSVAGGATMYLSKGAETLEVASYNHLEARYTVGRISMAVTAAPGAGNTSTYTLRKSGVDTTMVATMTGAGVFAAAATTPAPSIVFDHNDFLSLKLVTTASVATAAHRGYITMFEY